MNDIPNKSLRTLTATTLSVVMAVGNVAPVWAANHPNSSVQNVNVLNLTANVDWDYDAATPPTQVANPSQVLDKTYVTGVLRDAARKLYLMTEGRHRVGTVYVYKNSRFADNVDIRMLNVDGRSSASGSAWNRPSGTSTNYGTIAGTPYTREQWGNVIAHEMGHYLYGLFDEYREVGRALDTAHAYLPADGDWARPTAMHQQNNYSRLSIASDYESGKLTENQTAQARMYATNRADLTGGSAWETLVRDPKSDPLPMTQSVRIWFDAFKNVTAPATTADLSKYVKRLCYNPGKYLGFECYDPAPSETFTSVKRVPQADIISVPADYAALVNSASGGSATQEASDGQAGSAFENFKVVFADSLSVPTNGGAARHAQARTMLVIDNSMQTGNIGFAVEAARGVINMANETDQIGIALGDGTSPLLSDLVTTNASGKARLLAALAAYQPTQGTLNLTGTYAMVSPKLRDLPRVDGDADGVTLITYPKTAVSADLAEDARSKRLPISVLTFSTYYPESTRLTVVSTGLTVNRQISVEDLSMRSGGHAVRGKSVEDALSKEAIQARMDHGDNIAELTGADIVFAGARSESTPFTVTSVDKGDVTVEWHFDPADRAKLSFKLVPPSGTAVTVLDADSDLADGYASITVNNADASKNGAWQAVTTSTAATKDPVALSVIGETDVHLEVQVTGPERGLKPILSATFLGKLPITKGIVRATVYDVKTGAVVKSGLVLHDDGVGLDLLANDGIYTLDLDGVLPAGDYEIDVTATTDAGSTFESANLIFAGCADGGNCSSSAGAVTVAVGAGVMRTDVTALSLGQDSPGVVADTSASSSSGGCTVAGGDQKDVGLLVLLAVALAGLGLRRRRR